MKRVAIYSKMGERRAAAVVIAQLPTLLKGGNLGDKVDQVVRIDLALLLVQEAVNLVASRGVQEEDTESILASNCVLQIGIAPYTPTTALEL